MTLNRSSQEPYYRQIASDLRRQIAGGHLRPGDRLPSESELAGQWGTTRNTIRQAIRQLIVEGLVQSKKGRGVFVRERGTVRRLSNDRFARRHREAGKAALVIESEQQGVEWGQEVRGMGEVAAPSLVAARLDLEDGETVYVRRRLMCINQQPTQLADSYFPLDIAVGQVREENTGPGGVYARIEEAGHTLTRFEEELSARMPTPDEIEVLQLPREGVPVVDLVRVAYAGDRAVECFTAVMAADKHTFFYEFKAT